jgi:hypothetical protein
VFVSEHLNGLVLFADRDRGRADEERISLPAAVVELERVAIRGMRRGTKNDAHRSNLLWK